MPKPLCNCRGNGISNGMIPHAVVVFFPRRWRISPVFRESLNALYLYRNEPAHTPVWIPDIIPAPVRSGMPGRFGINAVCPSFYERPRARISKDCLKEAGRFLPIWSTRRKIPIAAFWLKKYLSGTGWVSMYGSNEHSLA